VNRNLSTSILTNNDKMKKVQCLLVSAIFLMVSSCSQDYPEVGSGFFDEVSFEVATWDTVTMKMSTVYFDSTISNNASRLLVGKVSDEKFGYSETQPYFKLSPSSTSSLDDFDDLEYQYATLTLYYEGYSIGDTTGAMSLEVYTLQDEMEADEDNYLYTISTLDLEVNDLGVAEPIGTIEFTPEPFEEDSVEITLNDDLGLALFELFESDFEENDFLEIIQGITIKTVSSESVIGFTVEPVLNVYYNESTELDVEEKKVVFTPDTEDQILVFNHIENDRTGTSLENVEELLEMEPDADGQLYIQGGQGLALKIELPYIKQIIEADEELLLDQVTISLQLGNEMPDDFGSLQNGIEIFRADHNNDILYQYSDAFLTWNLESEFDTNNEYEIDITTFVNEQLAITTADNEDALLIRVPAIRYANGLDQIVVYSQGAGNNDSKIKLNVIKIK